MKKTVVLCFVVLFSAVIFLTASVQENTLSKEDETAIRKLHDIYEKNFFTTDWTSTMIEFYAEDAVQMPPNKPVIAGKDSIQAQFESFQGNLSWEHRERPIKVIEGRDDLAFTWSIFKGKGKRNGESFSNGAAILTIFRKQKDGSWKIVCDIWSYDK